MLHLTGCCADRVVNIVLIFSSISWMVHCLVSCKKYFQPILSEDDSSAKNRRLSFGKTRLPIWTSCVVLETERGGCCHYRLNSKSNSGSNGKRSGEFLKSFFFKWNFTYANWKSLREDKNQNHHHDRNHPHYHKRQLPPWVKVIKLYLIWILHTIDCTHIVYLKICVL